MGRSASLNKPTSQPTEPLKMRCGPQMAEAEEYKEQVQQELRVLNAKLEDQEQVRRAASAAACHVRAAPAAAVG